MLKIANCGRIWRTHSSTSECTTWGLLGADRHTIGGYHDRKGAERGANDLDKNCTGVQTGFFCLRKCVLEPGQVIWALVVAMFRP